MAEEEVKKTENMPNAEEKKAEEKKRAEEKAKAAEKMKLEEAQKASEKEEAEKRAAKKEKAQNRRRSRGPLARAASRTGGRSFKNKARPGKVAFELKNADKGKQSDYSITRVRDFWKEIQKRQAEQLKKAKVSTMPAKISYVRIVTDEFGKESVKVSFAGGGSFQDAGKNIKMMRDIRRKTPPADRIYLLMMAIKEKGWRAVEGKIPPELREEVMKACSAAGVSLTAPGKEEEAVRQQQQQHMMAAMSNDNSVVSDKNFSYDFKGIDSSRPYKIDTNKNSDRKVWREASNKRAKNVCDVLRLSADKKEFYESQQELLENVKERIKELKSSGKLTPEIKEELERLKIEKHKAAAEQALTIALDMGVITQEKAKELREKGYPSNDPAMQEAFKARNVAEHSSQEECERYASGDKTVGIEATEKRRREATIADLQKKAAFLGIPVPTEQKDIKRLNQDYEYFKNLEKLYPDDLKKVQDAFQAYLQQDEKGKKQERSNAQQQVSQRPKKEKTETNQTQQAQQPQTQARRQITFKCNDSDEAAMIKLSIMKAALQDKDNPDYDAMRKALAEKKIYSVEDFFNEKRLNNALNSIDKKVYGFEVSNAIREANGRKPFTQEEWDRFTAPKENEQPQAQQQPQQQEVKQPETTQEKPAEKAAEPKKISAAELLKAKGAQKDQKDETVLNDQLRRMQSRETAAKASPKKESGRGAQWEKFAKERIKPQGR